MHPFPPTPHTPSLQNNLKSTLNNEQIRHQRLCLNKYLRFLRLTFALQIIASFLVVCGQTVKKTQFCLCVLSIYDRTLAVQSLGYRFVSYRENSRPCYFNQNFFNQNLGGSTQARKFKRLTFFRRPKTKHGWMKNFLSFKS